MQIFTEMERTLKDEIDFLREAQSANKIAAAVSHLPNNQPVEPPVIIPLPITGLVSRHVLVMEYVEGTPLSKLSGNIVILLFYKLLILNFVENRGNGEERSHSRISRV